MHALCRSSQYTLLAVEALTLRPLIEIYLRDPVVRVVFGLNCFGAATRILADHGSWVRAVVVIEVDISPNLKRLLRGFGHFVTCLILELVD